METNESIKQVKPNKENIEIVKRVLDQNEMILRMNVDLIKVLAMPPLFIWSKPESK